MRVLVRVCVAAVNLLGQCSVMADENVSTTVEALCAVAIHQARVDGANWLGHIDTDELVFPAGSLSYSMHDILKQVPDTVR